MSATGLARASFAALLFITLAAAAPQGIAPPRLYDLGHALAAYRPAPAGSPRAPFVPVDRAAPFPGAEDELPDVRVSYSGKFSNPANHGFFSGDLHFWDHTSTHLDAPIHYVPAGARPERQRSVGELGVAQLHGPLVIIDTSRRADRNVTAADIDRVRDRLVGGAWLFANLGHAARFGQPDYAVDAAPGFTTEACERLSQLVEAGSVTIAGIGADNGSVDRNANFRTMPQSCHGLLLPRNIPLIENLADLSAVSADPGKCDVVVAPLKVIGGSGSPTRVFARCE